MTGYPHGSGRVRYQRQLGAATPAINAIFQSIGQSVRRAPLPFLPFAFIPAAGQAKRRRAPGGSRRGLRARTARAYVWWEINHPTPECDDSRRCCCGQRESPPTSSAAPHPNTKPPSSSICQRRVRVRVRARWSLCWRAQQGCEMRERDAMRWLD